MPHPLKINTRSELSKYPLKKMDKVLVLGKKKLKLKPIQVSMAGLRRNPSSLLEKLQAAAFE